MKLNKKGEALGTGDKQAEAALRNKAQRVVITGCCQAGWALRAEPCRGQVLFSVFINGMDDGLEMRLKVCA